MSKLKSLVNLLEEEVKDLYSAETQLVKALPKMAKAASFPALRNAFEAHLTETHGHVERLEAVAQMLEVSPRGKSCKAMNGLIDEGQDTIMGTGEDALKDLALIVAAQKVEHYEISGYGSAISLAETIGLKDVVKLLQATIEEEKKADQLLTGLAKKVSSSLELHVGR